MPIQKKNFSTKSEINLTMFFSLLKDTCGLYIYAYPAKCNRHERTTQIKV